MATTLTKKDFQTDQDVRWCPGCGDYAILKSVQTVLPTLGIPKEKFVFVSGIGCSSRFPYYMDTYGFHTIHGRAFTVATGVKAANPDLSVWVITGDGDALSIGGNHFIHLLRRNADINVLLFNNRIYGLTKGQTSPTSEMGKQTKSTPYGNLSLPFNPLSLALGAGATFVARSVDIYAKHLQGILTRAAEHRGTSFVEIYQNCNIFNDNAFEYMTEKSLRQDNQIELEHGQPLIFGKERDRGIRLRDDMTPEVVQSTEGLLVHDEKAPAVHPYLISRLSPPDFPTPIGILRAVDAPTYDSELVSQQADVRKRLGAADLGALLNSGDTWSVS